MFLAKWRNYILFLFVAAGAIISIVAYANTRGNAEFHVTNVGGPENQCTCTQRIER